MGIYGNKFIEREVTLEDAIIQFESECNQYSKIFESVNILNESGIILEFSFKDIIEKIKDFFRMIGRKIKELWDKIFHRNQNIDDKINEANAIYDAWEDSDDDYDDFEDIEDLDDEEFKDNKEIGISDEEAKRHAHKIMKDHELKDGKWIKHPYQGSFKRFDPKRRELIKDIKYTSAGKSITKKVRIKLSKKKAKEIEVEYHVIPKFTTMNPSIGGVTVLHDITRYFKHNLKKDSIENIFNDADFDADIEDILNGHYTSDKQGNFAAIAKEYDMGIFNGKLSIEKASISKAKEYLTNKAKELDIGIEQAKNAMKLFEDNATEQEKVAAELEKLPEEARNNSKISTILSKAASKDLAICKGLFLTFSNYYNGLLGFKSKVASDLARIANIVATEVK